MAGKDVTLVIEKGATWNVRVALTDANKQVFPLTGYTGRCQIKKKATDATPVATATVTIENALGGVLLISLTATQTSQIPSRGATFSDYEEYVYDLEIIHTETGNVFRVLNGIVKVSPEVTA